MGPVSYVKGSTKYSVQPITTYEMIDHDIGLVIDIIEDTPIDLYRKNMEMGVDQGLTYAIFKGNVRVGFVYNRVEKGKYYGSSIFIDKDIIGLLVALRTMFEIVDKKTITFAPHKDNLKYFKSMTTGESIRAYHSGKSTVVILKEKMLEEGVKLFKYFGLERV